MNRNPRFAWLIWVVVCQHLVWGILLIGWPELKAAAIIGGYQFFLSHFSTTVVGVGMIAVALSTAAGLWLWRRLPDWWSIGLLMPQYLVVVASFLSCCYVIATQEVMTSSGSVSHVKMPLLLEFESQFMIVAFFHTFAVIERWLERARRPVVEQARAILERELFTEIKDVDRLLSVQDALSKVGQ